MVPDLKIILLFFFNFVSLKLLNLKLR
jgi:hypothetical protein